MTDTNAHNTQALLGDEAVALGAIHSGLCAAYGYPGTPSTEIMEYLIDNSRGGDFVAQWCSNEKTALEAALGTCFAGGRAIVTMKHVGLNVAADPFMNGALLETGGALVIAVADDPSMHSSQGEQDSRFYAGFAMVPCLEPRSQQEAYDMTREAFEISQKFQVPVMLRLVTRLSHARAAVSAREALPKPPVKKAADKTRRMLLPAYARSNYARLIEKQKQFLAWAESHPANRLEIEACDTSRALITSGLGGNYYDENADDYAAAHGGKKPARLHIGAYPVPAALVQKLCEKAETVLVIEEGQPLIEEKLRGLLPQRVTVRGRFDGAVPRQGELDPDKVRVALGLAPRPSVLQEINHGPQEINHEPHEPHERGTGDALDLKALPGRPPQLCQGCPHGDSYATINAVVAALDSRPEHPDVAVTSDIGCYSLGAAPPYSAIESIVCMGASIGMARGAAQAGIPYAAAVIGDSTFLHSGIPALIDCVAAAAPVTIIILDNSIVAMTGCQPTIVPSPRLRALIAGCGVAEEHIVELEAKSQHLEENAERLKKEVQYRGVSVVIFKRECLEAFRKRNKK